MDIGAAGDTGELQQATSSPDPDWVQTAWTSYLQGAMAAQADAQATVSEAALVAAVPPALPHAAAAAPAATASAPQPIAKPAADAPASTTVPMSSQVGTVSFPAQIPI